MAALTAGKHVHTEKPLAISLQGCGSILALARKKGLRVGRAPDTFLGAGIQTCLRLIDEGASGSRWRRPPSWPITAPRAGTRSRLLLRAGRGPVFDMGPYYFTPHRPAGARRRVSRVSEAQVPSASSARGQDGETIDVEVPTHAAGTIDFECGAIATFIMSFDVWNPSSAHRDLRQRRDPQRSGPEHLRGPVRMRGRRTTRLARGAPESSATRRTPAGWGSPRWLTHRRGRPHRASGALGLHALEIMHAGRARRLGRGTERESALAGAAPRAAAGLNGRRSPGRHLLTPFHTMSMVFHMKTTLIIDDTVMKALKREAAASGRTMSELVETALRMLLSARRRPAALPELPVFDGGGARVDIANRDALYDLMEQR